MTAEPTPEDAPAEVVPDPTRRCKVLWLSGDLLIGVIATGHWFRLTADLPKDTEVVAIAPDWQRQTIGVLVRHASFPETEIGEQYPSAGAVAVETFAGDRRPDRRCQFPHCIRAAEVIAVDNREYCRSHFITLRAHDEPEARPIEGA